MLRKTAPRRRLLYLLSLLFVCQGLFPLQMHTTLVEDTRGQLVTVCTLHGVSTVPTPDLPAPSGEDYTPSAAMLFSHLLASAVVADISPLLLLQGLSFHAASTAPAADVSSPQLRSLPIRAPPFV